MNGLRADWESGFKGRLYALGRRTLPLRWRRAIRRFLAPERLIGIRKPAIALARFDFDPMTLPSGRPDVLVLPVIPWSYRRQRPQQLAEALARRGKRVFYLSLEESGEPDAPTGIAPGVMLLPVRGVRQGDVAGRSLGGRALDKSFESLARAREQFGLRETAMFVQSPFWAPLAFQLRDRFGWMVVYDCLDEHTAFETNRAELLLGPEQELVRRADLVLATSQPLFERLRSGNPGARHLPNACDYELFARRVPRAADPERLVIGYAGAVDRWFDGDLVAQLARQRPLWRFEIVGGVENEARGLPVDLPNVAIFGERPHGEMSAFRSRWDVEIIPFQLSVLTHAADPVKLYEAAAAGLPIVATPMRSLHFAQERGIVRLAATAEEFVLQIESAVAEPPSRVEERRAFARENTWDERAGVLVRWLGEKASRVRTGAAGAESLDALARQRSPAGSSS
jgi:glycosyltransferase involved in cell wall biosynthesis